MSKICTSYAMYVNKKHRRVGHVFQDKFKAVLIDDDSHFKWVSAYIHTNPVKDGLVKTPSQWEWSSYGDFTSARNLPIVYKKLLKSMFGDNNSFKKETSILSSEKGMSRTVLDI